jgi:energy-coupling factor transporter ATP-binding protein EcfA2
MRPRYLVLDEPVAHLDAAGVRAVLDALRCVAEAGTGVLMAEARTTALAEVADSVAVIAAGNIVARGVPREVLADPTVVALGIEELPELRLRRHLAEAGLDPTLLEATS